MWKMNRIMRDLSAYRAAQEVIKQQAKELGIANRLRVKADSALVLAKRINEKSDSIADIWKERYEIKDEQVVQLIKEKRKIRRTAGTIVLLALIGTAILVKEELND